jgi:acyl-homoserine-lactone acylase
MPASKLPRLLSADFVANSNDSYWLSNPDAPLEGYSPIVGDERTARTLRTRAGISLVREVLGAEPPQKFDGPRLRALMYGHRNFAAELVLDEVLALCGEAGYRAGGARGASLRRACDVLGTWDRRHGVDSRGAHLFHEFWKTASAIPNLWAVPFDPAHPVDTPRGIRDADPQVRAAVLAALAGAVRRLQQLDIPLDAPWGEVHFVERGGARIGIPGGAHLLGMFSVMHAAEPTRQKRYSPMLHGNSYIQVVGWDDAGAPDAHAILTYSQSQESDSPHAADQTRLYSEGGWIRLPFAEDDILKDPELRVLELRAPADS